MLTPLDIQNKKFKKTLRGYDIKAVEEFLEEIMYDYEKVYKENVELKDVSFSIISTKLIVLPTFEK